MCGCEDGPSTIAISRREFTLMAASAGLLLITGCGGGGGKPFTGGGSTGGAGSSLRNRTLAVNSIPGQVSSDDGVPINFLTSFSDNYVQAAFWGTQNTNGTADQFYQALAWDADLTTGSRVQFDAKGLPGEVVDLTSGGFVTIVWGASNATIKLYQSNGAYIGGVNVAGGPTNYTITQLADSKIVGYYSGALGNTTQGIFGLTLGGAQAGAKGKFVKPGIVAFHPSTVPTTQKYAALTKALELASSLSDSPTFGATLLKQLYTEFEANQGGSELFDKIYGAATKGTGLSGTFAKGGQTLLRGLIVKELLNPVVTTFASQTPATLVAKGSLIFDVPSPGFTQYVASASLPAADPTKDTTLVTGIAAAREFGQASVNGYIDSTGKFIAYGQSSTGLLIQLQGTVAGTALSGQWTSSTTTRTPSGGGGMTGQQQTVGQCQSQEDSGGQGLFTNTYDLGDCGNFSIDYQMYTIPDEMIVLYNSQVLVDTGSVSGSSTLNLNIPGPSTIITIVMVASLDGTLWTYNLGCPS